MHTANKITHKHTHTCTHMQTKRIKYDKCNAYAYDDTGIEKPKYNGFCYKGGQLILILTMNSLRLNTGTDFQDDHTYYLMSMY